MSKQRPSKLDAWAEKLDAWLLTPDKGGQGLTLAAAQRALADDGCSVSVSRLADWWSARSTEREQTNLLKMIATGAHQVRELEAQYESNPAPEMDLLFSLHRTLILNLATKGNASPELLEIVTKLTQKAIDFAKLQQAKEDGAREDRKIKLLEAKVREASAEVQRLRDPKAALSEADREAIVAKVDDILGLK